MFECPILVSQGSSQGFPDNWKGAILIYFVAASDYVSALRKVAIHINSLGYKYEGVHNDKITQLDPSVWWEQYVMQIWPSLSVHLPSQEDIQTLVITGSMCQGPVLQWDSEVRIK